MEQHKDLLTSDFTIDEAIVMHLKETAKWSRFLGITGFIFSALIALTAIFVGNKITETNYVLRNLGAVVTIIYLIVSIIGFFISLYLFRFGSNMKVAIQNTDQEKLNTAFLNLKLYYRMMGIICVIYLFVLALFILVTGIGAAI